MNCDNPYRLRPYCIVDSCFPLAIFKYVFQPPCEYTHVVLSSTARHRVIEFFKFSSVTVRLLGLFSV